MKLKPDCKKTKDEDQSEEFDARKHVESGRRNRNKGKKVAHSCCILSKTPEGYKIMKIQQFVASSRVKIGNPLRKRAEKFSHTKNEEVSKKLLLSLKKYEGVS